MNLKKPSHHEGTKITKFFPATGIIPEYCFVSFVSFVSFVLFVVKFDFLS